MDWRSVPSNFIQFQIRVKGCLIKLESSRDKEMVMTNKSKPKPVKQKHLFVDNDVWRTRYAYKQK